MKVMGLKVNLGLEGLDMLFKPYERVLIRKMWEKDIEPTGSGALYTHVNTVLPAKPTDSGTKEAISRASVIFAANRFVDAGIWNYKTATGKGGHHRRYFAIMTEEELWVALRKAAVKRFGQDLTPKDVHDLAALTIYNPPAGGKLPDYHRYLYEKALGVLDPEWEKTYDSLE